MKRPVSSVVGLKLSWILTKWRANHPHFYYPTDTNGRSIQLKEGREMQETGKGGGAEGGKRNTKTHMGREGNHTHHRKILPIFLRMTVHI